MVYFPMAWIVQGKLFDISMLFSKGVYNLNNGCQAGSRHFPLKTLDTIGNCQRPVFSLGVSQHMHKITNLWKFKLNWSMKRKTPLSHEVVCFQMLSEVVCFQMLDFGTSNSKLEVSKSTSWKITSFSKTTSLQREPFLTMFFTINLSPLLVTK